MRSTRRLRSGFPATTAAYPSLFLRNAPSLVSRRSSPLRAPASGPWQWKQCSESTGRISLPKSIGLSAAASEAVAAQSRRSLPTGRGRGHADGTRIGRFGLMGWSCLTSEGLSKPHAVASHKAAFAFPTQGWISRACGETLVDRRGARVSHCLNVAPRSLRNGPAPVRRTPGRARHAGRPGNMQSTDRGTIQPECPFPSCGRGGRCGSMPLCRRKLSPGGFTPLRPRTQQPTATRRDTK